MKRNCTGRLAKEEKVKAFSILYNLFYYDIVPFCDDIGRCWLIIGNTRKRITTEEYYTLKEVGL